MEDVNVNTMVRAIGSSVLIKQSMIKKKTKILLDAGTNQKDKFDITFEVLQLGEKCTLPINVGDFPIFNEFVKFHLAKIIEKTDDAMVSLLLVTEGDIMGIDTVPDYKTITSRDGMKMVSTTN